MPGYREITVATEGRVRRPAAAARRPIPDLRGGGWRGVAVKLLRYGFAEGKTLCREKPGAVFSAVLALGAAGFVCVNALDNQKGRHPAPILPKVAPAKIAKGPAAPAATAPAPQEPVRDVAKAPVQAAAPAPANRDAIGDLIRAEDTTASVTPKAKPAPAEAQAPPDPTVARAQRALAKLGYGPIKADGAKGPATRSAIEKFERDHKLPVTGEAAGRTLRALEAGAAKG
jgi:hypothetical protein